jgi:hypothetical protein
MKDMDYMTKQSMNELLAGALSSAEAFYGAAGDSDEAADLEAAFEWGLDLAWIGWRDLRTAGITARIEFGRCSMPLSDGVAYHNWYLLAGGRRIAVQLSGFKPQRRCAFPAANLVRTSAPDMLLLLETEASGMDIVSSGMLDLAQLLPSVIHWHGNSAECILERGSFKPLAEAACWLAGLKEDSSDSMDGADARLKLLHRQTREVVLQLEAYDFVPWQELQAAAGDPLGLVAFYLHYSGLAEDSHLLRQPVALYAQFTHLLALNLLRLCRSAGWCAPREQELSRLDRLVRQPLCSAAQQSRPPTPEDFTQMARALQDQGLDRLVGELLGPDRAVELAAWVAAEQNAEAALEPAPGADAMMIELLVHRADKQELTRTMYSEINRIIEYVPNQFPDICRSIKAKPYNPYQMVETQVDLFLARHVAGSLPVTHSHPAELKEMLLALQKELNERRAGSAPALSSNWEELDHQFTRALASVDALISNNEGGSLWMT